jgi:large subunit ribosomal protein L16
MVDLTQLITLKFKKYHKNPIKGLETSKKKIMLKMGIIGLKILENGIITINQINIIKKLIQQNITYTDLYWLYYKPKYTITKKTGDMRMGKGKGNILTFIIVIKKGNIFIEFDGNNLRKLLLLLNKIKKKLPMRSKIILKKK